MQIKDLILCLIIIAVSFLLWFFCKRDALKYNNKWRLLYLLPILICFFHALFVGVEFCMSGIYLGSFLLLGGYIRTEESLRRLCAIIAIALCVLSVPVCFLSDGYRRATYLADFEEGFDTMKEHYSLTMHKQVDWNALYDKYQPLFSEVDKTQDETAYFTTWNAFCNEFYDCHTSFSPLEPTEEWTKKLASSVLGNDYGLSIAQLTSGEYVAASVAPDSAAATAGITTGTIITKWDGKAITEWLPEANARMRQCMVIGNVENEQFYEPLFVAGIGGDEVQVSYLANDGTEQTITLSSTGSYYDRFMTTYYALNYKTPGENMGVVSLNSDTILLNVNMMTFDSSTTGNADYSGMQSKLRDQFIAYREEGVSNLIIDLRNNAGGSSMMARAIVALMAEGEIFWAADGAYNETTGDYDVIKEYTCVGENLFDGGKVIVLVNSGSNSAANHLMAGIKQLDNVTVMGITEAAGTAQGMTSIPLHHGMLSFSMTTVLDENGDIWVDSDASGHSRLLVDEKIPLTRESLEMMLFSGEDYVLNYALEQLEK